jgi:hypothetical protein
MVRFFSDGQGSERETVSSNAYTECYIRGRGRPESDRCAAPDVDADEHANINCHVNLEADGHANADGYADVNIGADEHVNADRHADVGADEYANADWHANTDRHAYVDANEHAEANCHCALVACTAARRSSRGCRVHGMEGRSGPGVVERRDAT